MKYALIISALISAFCAEAFGCATTDLIASYRPGDTSIVLTRPSNQHEWVTTDGYFLIHYDTEGPNAVYHPDEDVDPADGIPDYVNRCAEFLSQSRQVIVAELRFDPPPSDNGQGGDWRYDIYLTNVPALTTPESPSDEYPGRPAYTSFIQLGHDMRTPRYPDDPLPYLMISAAHEYFHAVQFAYRAYSSDPTLWWFESSAVWMEDMVFDDINDVYYQLHDYLPQMHRSLYQTSGFFIYGAWLYPDFLAETVGASIIRKAWEKFASFDKAVEALRLSLDELGLDFNTEYCRHAIWNYFTGTNYRSGFYEEGSLFGESIVVAASYSEYPVQWSGQPIPQENISAAYLEFLNQDVPKGSFVLEYENPTDDLQYISIVAIRNSGEIQYSIYRVENHINPTYVVPDFSSCDKVIIIPVWAYEGQDNEGTTAYSYRAFIDSTSTSIPSSEGTPTDFRLEGVYPNPFNGSVSLAFTSPREQDVRVSVFDIAGRRVLVRNIANAGGYCRVNLEMPESQAGGVYFFTLESARRSLSGKMIYLK